MKKKLTTRRPWKYAFGTDCGKLIFLNIHSRSFALKKFACRSCFLSQSNTKEDLDCLLNLSLIATLSFLPLAVEMKNRIKQENQLEITQ